jgi:hypothetical protein
MRPDDWREVGGGFLKEKGLNEKRENGGKRHPSEDGNG